MGRNADNAPIKNTCPIIDDVVSYVDRFRKDYSDDDSAQDFKDCLSVIEDIREANSTLREWGNEQYQRAEIAESDNGYLQSQLDDKGEEIKQLQKEIERLENQLEAV